MGCLVKLYNKKYLNEANELNGLIQQKLAIEAQVNNLQAQINNLQTQLNSQLKNLNAIKLNIEKAGGTADSGDSTTNSNIINTTQPQQSVSQNKNVDQTTNGIKAV